MVLTAAERKQKVIREFSFYYGGTILLLVFLDYHHLLFNNPFTVWEVFPPNFVLSDGFQATGEGKAEFVLLGMVLTVPLHLWRMAVKAMFAPVARHGAGLHPKSVKYNKFLEQAWLGTHYTMVFGLEVYALYKPEWFPPTVSEQSRLSLLADVSTFPKNDIFWLEMVYLIQYTFYFMEFFTLIYHIFFDKGQTRSDVVVYFIHHVLTVFLISMSYVCDALLIGVYVLFFHDCGDIFLAIAKCFVYCEDYARSHYSRKTQFTLELLGTCFFVLFLITFGVARLIMYPTLIYVGVYQGSFFSRSYEVELDGPTPYTQVPSEYRFTPAPYGSQFACLTCALIFLFPLHVYWFRLALRVAYRAVLGIYDDERSDDEDEAPPNEKPIARKKQVDHTKQE